MRNILVSAALAAMALGAVPAAAQGYGQQGYGQQGHGQHQGRGYGQRGPDRQAVNMLLRDVERADRQIDRAMQRRFLSPREAQFLRREADQIRNRIHRSSRDGLSGHEFAQLRQRLSRLEERIRIEARDRDRHRG